MPSGWKTKLGVARESSWATLAACSELHPYLSERIVETLNLQPIPGVDGLGAYKYDKLLGSRCVGPITFPFPYLDQSDVSALMIGLAAGDAIEASGDCSYYPSDQQPGSATFCFDKDGVIYEYAGGKLQNIRIIGTVGNQIGCEADFIARSLDRASSINTSSVGWSLVDFPVLHFGSLDFRINAESGPALAIGDAEDLLAFEIALNGDWSIKQSEASGIYIDEPRRLKWEVIISLTLKTSTSILPAMRTAMAAETKRKMRFQFAATEGGVNYTSTIYIPSAKITMVDDSASDETRINPRLRFQGLLPDSAPLGFPSYLSEIIFNFARA